MYNNSVLENVVRVTFVREIPFLRMQASFMWFVIVSTLHLIQHVHPRFTPDLENDSRLEIVSADDRGNFYLYVEVTPGKKENTISKFEWDVISIDVKSKYVKTEANLQVIEVLANVLEVDKEQLNITGGVNESLKKVMLSGWEGTEIQLVHRIAFKYKYVLHTIPSRNFLTMIKISDNPNLSTNKTTTGICTQKKNKSGSWPKANFQTKLNLKRGSNKIFLEKEKLSVDNN